MARNGNLLRYWMITYSWACFDSLDCKQLRKKSGRGLYLHFLHKGMSLDAQKSLLSSPQTANKFRHFCLSCGHSATSPGEGFLGFSLLWGIAHARNGPEVGNGVILAKAVAYLLSVSRYLLMILVITAIPEHEWDRSRCVLWGQWDRCGMTLWIKGPRNTARLSKPVILLPAINSNHRLWNAK